MPQHVLRHPETDAPENLPPAQVDGQRAAAAESYRQLAEVFHVVLSEQSLDALLDLVADALAELVPYDTLTIYRADEAPRLLVPVLARDRWASEIMRMTIPFGAGLTGWAAEHREAVRIDRVELDPRAAVIPGTPADEPEALVSIPLVARGRLKGALNVYRLGEEATFSDAEFELAERFADAAALALDNAEIRARLEEQARTDGLTGLANHRVFHERLREELARADRLRRPVSVLMLDLDDFKRVNDLHGHAVGDEALARVAQLVSGSVRGSDVACRLGGEELGVVIPDCDAAGALILAERVRAAVAEADYGIAGPLSVSVGVAASPEHALNPRELAACAETAMMTAKAGGKGRVLVFGDEPERRPEGDSDRDVRSLAHLTMLRGLVARLGRARSAVEIGAAVVAELESLFDYEACRVFVVDLDELVEVAGHGTPGPSSAVARRTTASRMPAVEGPTAAAPITRDGRVIGVVAISKPEGESPDGADVRVLELVASQASVALEHARLVELAHREHDRADDAAQSADTLLSLSTALASAEDADAVAAAVECASRAVGAELAVLWLPLHGRLPDAPDAVSLPVPTATGQGRLIVTLDEGVDAELATPVLSAIACQASLALRALDGVLPALTARTA